VVADELLLVHAGTAVPFDGDLEDYARWLATSAAATPANPPAATAAAAEASAAAGAAVAAVATPRTPAKTAAAPQRATPEDRKARKRLQAQQREALGPLRAAVAEQERELARLLATRSEIEQQLARPATALEDDRQRLKQLALRQAELSRLIQGMESAWMEAAARLETLAARQQGVD
jgi:ATP-binding cassette subfamily F protein 3